MGTIRLILRTDKVDKHGKAPIDILYQVKGGRKSFRTTHKIYPWNWNAKDYLVTYLNKADYGKYKASVEASCKKEGKPAPQFPEYVLLPEKKEADAINDDLLGLQKQISIFERRYIEDGVTYSADMVIDKLSQIRKPATKKEERSGLIIEYIDKYVVNHKTTREANSLKIYKSLKNHLQNFIATSPQKVTFSSLDYSFFQRFQNFLIQEGLNNTTVAKQLSTLKTFINYARKEGLQVSDRYKDFKIKREKLEVIALTSEEFERLYSHDFKDDKKLAKVRDLFCFACVTGLRYSDLSQLTRDHIKNDEITLTVKKTKEQLSIPLTPYSKSILEKYKDMYRPLPVISNQKMNEYIKEVCKLEDIKIDEPIEIVRFRGSQREVNVYPKHELIGVHTARKTFVTLSLEKGMSAEEVMSISGHSDYKSFQRYVKITEQRKKVVMRKAWGESLPALKVV